MDYEDIVDITTLLDFICYAIEDQDQNMLIQAETYVKDFCQLDESHDALLRLINIHKKEQK